MTAITIDTWNGSTQVRTRGAAAFHRSWVPCGAVQRSDTRAVTLWQHCILSLCEDVSAQVCASSCCAFIDQNCRHSALP